MPIDFPADAALGATPDLSVAAACIPLGASSDGCGGTLNCGSCAAPDTCGGGGVANVCGAACIAMVAPPSASMNPGQACLGCHVANGSASGLVWTVAGTLYDSLSGANAIGGATIQITDAKGKVLDLVTDSIGNFYTSTAVTFPVTARASGCPNDATMPITASSGDCNSCHVAGNRIHLP